jgi:hypothetical protein
MHLIILNLNLFEEVLCLFLLKFRIDRRVTLPLHSLLVALVISAERERRVLGCVLEAEALRCGCAVLRCTCAALPHPPL